MAKKIIVSNENTVAEIQAALEKVNVKFLKKDRKNELLNLAESYNRKIGGSDNSSDKAITIKTAKTVVKSRAKKTTKTEKQ